MTRARSNANLSSRPLFSAYATANQAIPANVYTKVNCAGEDYDSHAWYDTALSRYTPQIAGYYRFAGAHSGGGTGARVVTIYKNGLEYRRGNQISSATSLLVSTTMYLNGTTDYVELFTYSEAAGGTNIGGGGALSERLTYFQGEFVRAA